MDQDAFRSLLNQPRAGGSASGSGSASRSRGVLGAPPKKRGWGLKPREGYEKKEEPKEEEKPMFAPRAHQKKQVTASTDVAYKDRAELRRRGGDTEFKHVEKLLEDFERRKEEAGVDADKVEQQRAHLGGDAEHSVLVKGLDFALLAKRKAELEREKLANVDDELDGLASNVARSKAVERERQAIARQEEEEKRKFQSKFKSIGQKQADAAAAAAAKAERKKKKKKAKAAEPEVPKAAPAKRAPSPSRRTRTPPPDPEDEDDIFGDVGTYDLATGREDEDEGEDEDSEDDRMDVDDGKRSRSRSRGRSVDSRSRSRSRSRDYRSRSRSRSRDRYRDDYDHDPRRRGDRERGYSRDRYDRAGRHDDRRDTYSRNDRDRYTRYSRSPDRDNYRGRHYRSRSRSRSRDYRRDRSPPHRSESRYNRDNQDRERYSRRRDRSDTPQDRPDGRRDSRRSDRYGSPLESRLRGRERDSRSQSPQRRASPSRSPSPPRRLAARRRSRSPTPLLQATIPFSRSPTPESEDEGPVTKLRPLAGSAIADVRSFLAADQEGAKDDARRANKAKWRAQQGLSMQDGVDPDSIRKDVPDKHKANRDYQLVMNRVKKQDAQGD